MAVQYASGKIVTNGLILALNAADMNSYDYRENLTPYSSLIGGTGYSLAMVSGSATLTASLAPDGTNTATLISQSLSNDYVYGVAGSNLITSSIYTYSIFAKQGDKSNFTFTIDENGFGGKRYQFTHTFATNALSFSYPTGVSNSGGVILSSGSVDAGNGWRRIFGTFQTSTGSVGGFVDMIARFGSTGGTTYVWGRQLEQRSSPTPYTPTLATNITASNIWYDLSGNNAHGTITGSVSFVYDGAKSHFNFATASDTNYIYSTVSQNYLDVTVVFQPDFTRIAGGGSNLAGLISNGTPASATDVSLRFGGVNGTGPWGAVNPGNGNDWANPTATTYYRNGTVSNSLVSGWNVFGGYRTNQSGFPLSFAYYLGSSGYPARSFQGKISAIYMYNRQLSAAEQLQNYNVIKSRFGLT
jgi:hypothetical protein